MVFCPVCGEAGQAVSVRCERVARHYGYSRGELAALAAAGLSIAVPFFDVRRFLFAIDTLSRHPLARAMLDAVERGLASAPVQDLGNPVRVLSFQHASFPEHAEIFIKEDVSKTMVVYQGESSIEHFGSEERAVVFAELACQYFGLGQNVPATVVGVSATGTKFVASAGVSRARFRSLEARPRSDLHVLWRRGTLPRLAILDFVLGQNDRNAQNVLVGSRDDAAKPEPEVPEALEVRLIDNDDAFSKLERLPSPFAYLTGLDDATPGAGALTFAGAHAWLAPLRLVELVAKLAPLALPEDTMVPLCRRFAFAKLVAEEGLSVSDFRRAAFCRDGEGGFTIGAPLPRSGGWTAYRAFVKEGEGEARFRTIVGEKTSDGFLVSVLDGVLLRDGAGVIAEARPRSQADAERAVESRVVDAFAEGFAHIVRRRFFVAPGDPARSASDPLRIVEIRTDPAGCHLVVKAGRLGRYERRKIERFASFATVEHATAAADGIEAELLAARYVDLRARLESFKAATEAALLW